MANRSTARLLDDEGAHRSGGRCAHRSTPSSRTSSGTPQHTAWATAASMCITCVGDVSSRAAATRRGIGCERILFRTRINDIDICRESLLDGAVVAAVLTDRPSVVAWGGSRVGHRDVVFEIPSPTLW